MDGLPQKQEYSVNYEIIGQQKCGKTEHSFQSIRDHRAERPCVLCLKRDDQEGAQRDDDDADDLILDLRLGPVSGLDLVHPP